MSISSYITKDFYLAVTLTALGFDCSLEEQVDKKILFKFDSKNGLDVMVQKYWRKELKIEVSQIFASYKLLKSRMYNEVWR